jgi:hypothetical protein
MVDAASKVTVGSTLVPNAASPPGHDEESPI